MNIRSTLSVKCQKQCQKMLGYRGRRLPQIIISQLKLYSALLGKLPCFEYVMLRYISGIFKAQIDLFNRKIKLICLSKFETKSAKVWYNFV